MVRPLILKNGAFPGLVQFPGGKAAVCFSSGALCIDSLPPSTEMMDEASQSFHSRGTRITLRGSGQSVMFSTVALVPRTFCSCFTVKAEYLGLHAAFDLKSWCCPSAGAGVTWWRQWM
eukprot:scaffold49321_cov19-Tisochrysis_lutea.AAC.1